MAYTTQFGLDQNVADYLNQPMPGITGIFPPPPATISPPVTQPIEEEVEEDEVRKFTPREGSELHGVPADQGVMDFEAALRNRQQSLKNPSWLSKQFGGGVPWEQMMVDQQKGTRPNIPGLTGILSKLLPDHYYDKMTLGDQIFTQQNMGYRTPGQYQQGGHKDPFGVNVRSAFGNYGEYVDKKAGSLKSSLGGSTLAKYKEQLGDDTLTWDEVTGTYSSTNKKNAAYVNMMTDMMQKKYGFYTPKSLMHKSIPSDLGLIKTSQQEKITQAPKKLAELTTQGGDHPGGKGGRGIAHADYSPGGGQNKARLYASRMGGGSQQAKSGGQKKGGTGRTDSGWGWQDGGIVSLWQR